jgi:hypothetical protein
VVQTDLAEKKRKRKRKRKKNFLGHLLRRKTDVSSHTVEQQIAVP